MDHEKRVQQYYSEFDSVYQSWDAEHYHLGFFDTHTLTAYKKDINLIRNERSSSIIRMIQKVIEPINIQKTDIVADCGCGVGGTAFHLWNKFGCRVIGLNISHTQLDSFNREIEKRNLTDQIESRWCDCGAKLPLETETIDVVVNIESACHYSDRNRFLSEVYRVLKPGGYLVVQDWMVEETISSDQHRAYVEPLCQAWHFINLESHLTYMEKLRRNGFKIRNSNKYHDQIVPNALLFESKRNYHQWMDIVSPSPKPDDEMLTQLDTFSKAVYDGCLLINTYFAVKQ